jgi:hypothetical protein
VLCSSLLCAVLCCTGDDPSTAGVSEVQVIDCTCADTACAGTLQLTVKGHKTKAFPIAQTGYGLLKYRLEVETRMRRGKKVLVDVMYMHVHVFTHVCVCEPRCRSV